MNKLYILYSETLKKIFKNFNFLKSLSSPSVLPNLINFSKRRHSQPVSHLKTKTYSVFITIFLESKERK